MIKLPKNEKHTPKATPRVFLIWGKPMSGKSYLAERFESPLVINTEGNAESGSAPFLKLVIEKDPNEDLDKQITVDQLDELWPALRKDVQGYKTLIFDVADEIFSLFTAYVIKNYNDENKTKKVTDLSGIPYGKGYSDLNTIVNYFMLQCKSLNMNVVFTSWAIDITDDAGNTISKPSLKDKQYNTIAGNADLVIETKRIGTNYARRVTDRRKRYFEEHIDDTKILNILKNVTGALEKTSAKKPETQPTTK
ncbi:hypothetical protein WS105_0646 [Weissella ceti]|uniref:AAA family ATPase n=1 Tax=Weissella ceti TaxID=759620 RepID=UPI0004F5D5CA|nr:AAA family ATPase [Weissella ceti]AIM64236.1 hypothetical protein WS105_0646 [Weissella ceti]